MPPSTAILDSPSRSSHVEDDADEFLGESLPGAAAFSIGHARGIVKDLFKANPWIYWTDFLLSIGVGVWMYMAIGRAAVPGGLIDLITQWLAWGEPGRWAVIAAFFVVQCLAIYRASLFTHELVHLQQGAVKGFGTGWNLMCGIPFLMPSFLYHTHVHHHRRRHYATHDDGEYLPLGASSPWNIFAYLGQSFVIPIIAVVRFGVLTPLMWVSSRIHRWGCQHLSAMVCDPKYVRPLPTRTQLRLWRLQEAGCLAMIWGAAVLLYLGALPWYWLIQAYATGVSVIMLNAIRTLGAHRYRHTGDEVSFVDQLLDSVNYPRWPLVSELWAPVGLRFHALHHLFPSMPYHNLAAAHRRLMRELPPDSPYRRTESPGLLFSIRQLWRDAKAAA